ncbi:MAG: hypothetical protein EHM61_15570 [Acidobacteria bacterium]|nr:MAG: hypothetical protein EHM61_15570 [Acidobacteriota bacterium]
MLRRVVRVAIPILTLFFARASADQNSTTHFTGLPGVRAIAFNARGELFASLPGPAGKVVQVVAPEESVLLATIGGSTSGLAFDAQGQLYVADPGRRSILKITPSGKVTVAADKCGGQPLVEPVDLVVSRSGLILCDMATSRICRLDGALVTNAVSKPSALAGTVDGRTVYAGDAQGDIWRLNSDGTGVRLLASLRQQIGGLALDRKGNLYVAGSAGLTLLTPEGRLINRQPFAEGLSDISFGIADRASLFVSQPTSGAIARLKVPNESQPTMWELDKPLRITQPADGDVLNRNDGTVTPEGLRITVRGEARVGGTVKINGAAAPVRDGKFETQVTVNEPTTRIQAQGPGGSVDEATVLWDRQSFPRYRVSVDDNIRWLKDIALHEPPYRSIFDNPYLGFWREMHQKYGAKVHFNIYYETRGFTLNQMPVRYKPEWQENADWIRLTFHARANDPDRPYLHSSADRIRQDYRLVTREIERFAGKELLSDVTTVHWGEATPEAVRALREEGVRILVGYFELRRELPAVSYDVTMPQLLHLMGRDCWKDLARDILFVRHDMVINGVKLDDVVPRLEKLAYDPHQSEVIELMIHEQYWYPDYVAYLPDYRERVAQAIQWVAEKGYKPVFFGEGFLGAK